MFITCVLRLVNRYCSAQGTVRGKILEWEKIGEFGESWALRQYFTRQLFLFRIFQLATV